MASDDDVSYEATDGAGDPAIAEMLGTQGSGEFFADEGMATIGLDEVGHLTPYWPQSATTWFDWGIW